MSDRDQVFESRKSLLNIYVSNTVQFTGFALSLAIVFFGEVNLLSQKALASFIIWGLILATFDAAAFVMLNAVYWGRMAYSAIEQGVPRNLEGDILKTLHDFYTNQVNETRKFWFKRMNLGKTSIRIILITAPIVFILGSVIAFLLQTYHA